MFAELSVMFSLGVLSSLSPCFFPLFPSFLAYIAEVENSIRRGFIAGLACSFGILISFMIYGFSASLLVQPILAYGSLLRYLFGIGIMILGVVMITPLKRIFFKIRPPKSLHKLRGILGAFILGFLFTIIAAPCATPLFLSAILLALTLGSLLNVIIALLVFSFGASLPFIAASLLVSAAKNFVIRSYGKFSRLFEQISALTLILTGLLLLFSAFGLPSIF